MINIPWNIRVMQINALKTDSKPNQNTDDPEMLSQFGTQCPMRPSFYKMYVHFP